jgi:RHS repeat-associated protein
MRHLQKSKLLVLVGLAVGLGMAGAAVPGKPRLLKPVRPQGTAPSSVVGQTSTLLPSGKLLLLGGEGPRGIVSTAAIRDPTSGITTPLPNGLSFSRAWHTATLLPDGTIFVFGGIGTDGQVVSTAERFDPATGLSQVAVTAGLIPRAHHTSTLLTDGRVLLAGGISDSGEILGTGDLWDSRTSATAGLPANLLIPARDHSAFLQPNGEVLLWGGIDSHGSKINFGEIFDPETLSFRMQTAPVLPINQVPVLEASIPADGSENAALDTLIAFRFSKPLLVTTVNSTTVTLTGPSGPLVAKVVPAEDGMLVFVTPESPLLASTSYTISLSGTIDSGGNSLPQTLVTFTTAGSPEAAGIPFGPSEPNNSGTNGIDSRFQKLPPLQAPPGVTAVAGQSLRLNGLPLEDLRLTVEDQNITAETDGTGRFLLKGLSAGHHVLFVDGRPASKKDRTYGTYEIGIDITAGQTNVLTYTIWMTELDTAHAVKISSPTTNDVVVTNPTLPGLELHIPAGTVIRDHQGNVVTQITITPVPLKQPPFPLPNVPVPIYFTIQPGGAYLNNPGWTGARLYYPNAGNAPVGTRYDFWNYDPDKKGWYVYGHGSVAPDRKEIIPDPGVVIYEFTGAMVGSPGQAPPTFPPAGDGSGGNPPGAPPDPPPNDPPDGDGEPVDLATGLFVYQKTDLVLPDILPVELKRTYRQSDSISRAFGIGTTHSFDIFLVGDTFPYTYAELILPDGGRIRYNRTSSGTGYTDAVYVHSDTGSIFYGSVISWNGSGWNLKLKNGTIYGFPDGYNASRPQQAALISIRDRYGNAMTISRDSNSNLTQITTPSGRWIKFTYDSSYRINQAQDNIGRTVTYAYDTSGRLWTVTDAKNGVTTFTYDSNNNMLTITDPRNITYLTNQYDSNNRVIKQTLGDSTTYLFSYTLTSNTSQTHFVTLGSGYNGGGPGVDITGFRNCSGCQEAYTPQISETDVTDQRGYVRKVLFGSNGYISSDTRAYGTSQQQTVTYQYFPDNLAQSSTDALNRTTAYVYDANADTTQVTRLSGTSNALTTTYTYESTYNQLASVTDPLNHTTGYGHDTSGNVNTITDPLNHQTTFAYNSQGQVTSATDSLGNTSKFVYSQGILAETVDPLGRGTSKTLDGAGRVIGNTDPTGALTQTAYDGLNEVTSTTDALRNLTSFTYDGNGNLLTVTDANNHTTTYTYDNMDRISTRKDALNNSESYTYDVAGNLSTFTDRRGKVTSYTYDPLNRRTFAGFNTQAGPTYDSTISYGYDAGNRLSGVVDSAAGTITPTFDNLDRLTKEVSSQGTVNYAFDAAGRRTSMTVAGQTAVNYSYDNANRLTGMTQGTSTSVSFAYDNANKRSALTLPNGIVVTYSYDTASQLTGITYTNGSTTLGNLIYSYDLAGRRTGVGGSYAQVNLPLAVSATVYNANNQLTTWGTANLYYDANGNMTSDGTNSYTWNARNQLTSMNFSNVTFLYDGYGRRTGKTISSATTNYLYDDANVVQELSGTTVTANLLTGLGVDERFTRTDANGIGNFLSDALGSTIALTNSSGSTLASYAYEPFGNTTVTSGSLANPYQYTGRESDATGLYFDRARYYSPTFQRFISEDPVGFRSGATNLYGYANNDPSTLIDPSGLCTVAVGYSPLGAGNYHTFIVSNDANGSQFFRGGPANSGGIIDLASATSGRYSGSSGSDSGSGPGYGPLTVTSGDYVPYTVDNSVKPDGTYDTGQFFIQVLNVGGSCKDYNSAFQQAADAIGNAKIPYNPFTTNSNAFTSSLLGSAGLPTSAPPVSAPGWGHPLH